MLFQSAGFLWCLWVSHSFCAAIYWDRKSSRLGCRVPLGWESMLGFEGKDRASDTRLLFWLGSFAFGRWEVPQA